MILALRHGDRSMVAVWLSQVSPRSGLGWDVKRVTAQVLHDYVRLSAETPRRSGSAEVLIKPQSARPIRCKPKIPIAAGVSRYQFWRNPVGDEKILFVICGDISENQRLYRRFLISKAGVELAKNHLEEYRQDFEDEHKGLRLEMTKDGLYVDASVQSEWIKWAEYQRFLSLQW